MSKEIKRGYDYRIVDTEEKVLRKEWDKDKAEDVYKLYSRYETFTDYLNIPKRSIHYEATGDREWADRTAEHYGIEIEGEE